MSDRPEGLCIRMVSEARQTFSTEAASQLWLKLRLPLVPAMLNAARQGNLFERDLKIIEGEQSRP
jgi:hypothetical protein